MFIGAFHSFIYYCRFTFICGINSGSSGVFCFVCHTGFGFITWQVEFKSSTIPPIHEVVALDQFRDMEILCEIIYPHSYPLWDKFPWWAFVTYVSNRLFKFQISWSKDVFCLLCLFREQVRWLVGGFQFNAGRSFWLC